MPRGSLRAPSRQAGAGHQERMSQLQACPQALGPRTGTPISAPRTTLAACPWPPALPGFHCPWGEVHALKPASRAGQAHALPPPGQPHRGPRLGAWTTQTGKGLRAQALEKDLLSNPNSTLLPKVAGNQSPKLKDPQGFTWTVSSSKSRESLLSIRHNDSSAPLRAQLRCPPEAGRDVGLGQQLL